MIIGKGLRGIGWGCITLGSVGVGMGEVSGCREGGSKNNEGLMGWDAREGTGIWNLESGQKHWG